MSKKIIFNVELKCSDTMEMITGLVRTASRVVDKLDEDTRKEILVKLVVHAMLQDSGFDEKVDAVALLQDRGLYMGLEAKKRMMRE